MGDDESTKVGGRHPRRLAIKVSDAGQTRARVAVREPYTEADRLLVLQPQMDRTFSVVAAFGAGLVSPPPERPVEDLVV
jgi:hypothetical protein